MRSKSRGASPVPVNAPAAVVDELDAILEKNRKDLFRDCEKYQQHGIESKAAYFSFCESVFHILGEINEKKIELTRLKRDIGSFREEAGEKIIADIARLEQKKEEKLSRTQQLNTVKIQALKELGYTEITPENASEIFEKIAEIEGRKAY